MKKIWKLNISTISIAAALFAVGCAPLEDPQAREQVAALEARIAELEKSIEGLESSVAGIRNSEPDMQSRLDEAKESIGDFRRRLSGIENINTRILASVDNLESEIFFKEQISQIKALYPDAIATKSGLHYVVTQEGEGEETPIKGNKITAHYSGTLMDGTPFDSSIERGEPFSFNVGIGRVIKGWDEAFLDMKKGEKRTLAIPSKLAYGSREIPDAIPANSILVFDVELIDFGAE